MATSRAADDKWVAFWAHKETVCNRIPVGKEGLLHGIAKLFTSERERAGSGSKVEGFCDSHSEKGVHENVTIDEISSNLRDKEIDCFP